MVVELCLETTFAVEKRAEKRTTDAKEGTVSLRGYKENSLSATYDEIIVESTDKEYQIDNHKRDMVTCKRELYDAHQSSVARERLMELSEIRTPEISRSSREFREGVEYFFQYVCIL